MHIGLVGDIEHQFVGRGVEHIVQCDGRLQEAEVRAYMAAICGKPGGECGTQA